jgi:ribosomal protein S18 acetylase RimI-like enzyme
VSSLRIAPVDLNDPRDARDYREQLAAYALDPMGGGTPLPAHRLDRAIGDLRQMPHARLFLARIGDQAVGFATCFSAYSTFRARPLWNIHDIAVLASHRGQGIGRALIEQIADTAQGEGCCRLTLEVREDNPIAEGLYRKLGFTAAQIQNRQVQYLFLEKALAPG